MQQFRAQEARHCMRYSGMYELLIILAIGGLMFHHVIYFTASFTATLVCSSTYEYCFTAVYCTFLFDLQHTSAVYLA